jgi:hypothetical protein
MAGEGTITVRCTCGKKLKAPAESAGKKARCPACGAVLRLIPMEAVPARATESAVTASATRSAAVDPPPLSKPRTRTKSNEAPAHDDGLGALYELSEQAENATMKPEGPVCPSCQSSMNESAVLCTSCGYDTRTGKSLTVTKEAPVLNYASPKGKGKSKGLVDRMAPQGSFVVGLILAGVFGVVCSVLWIVVMFVTGYEIGILATVVGWTVGLGMQIGQKGYSRRGGMTAATIAVLAIAGPKLILMALLLALTHGNNAGEIGYAFFHPLTILFIFLGIGAAYRTANGSSS